MHIFTLLVGLLINHFLQGQSGWLGAIRQYGWIGRLHDGIQKPFSKLPDWAAALLPVMVCLLLLFVLDAAIRDVLGRLFGWLLALLVLLFCLGPRDVRADVSRVINTADNDSAKEEITKLDSATTTEADNPQQRLIHAVFRAGLQRWFAVIFWFVLFGIYGALGYRVSRYLADRTATSNDTSNPWFARLAKILEWPAAQLMTLAIAIASDFDQILSVWRAHMQKHGHGLEKGDYGFMLQAAVAALLGEPPADAKLERNLYGNDGTAAASLRLLQRVLNTWLLLFGIILLTSWIF